jgi:hypothetical protein
VPTTAPITVPVIPASVSRRQFFQGAAVAGIITQAEALASGSVVPESLVAAIGTLPADEQFAARMAILFAANFERADSMVADLGAAMNRTSAQIDALFTLAGSL